MNILFETILAVSGFSIVMFFYYQFASKYTRLSLKQKAYLLSTGSALVLSGCSVTTLENQNMSIYFFTSYLLTDLYYAYTEYHIYSDALTTYIHHIFYIFVNIFCIYTDSGYVYNKFFVLEVPTFFLSLGTMFPVLRSDLLFGAAFFTTRIVYHFALLLIHCTGDTPTFMISMSTWCMHLFWFKKWYVKYGRGLIESPSKK